MAPPKAKEDAIIIGIDFGTTFSGVAWAYSREPDEVELVTDWDALLTHCSDVEKTPTQIYYGQLGEATEWGYAIPLQKEALKWFKLLLLDEKDIPNDVSASSQLMVARRLRTVANKDPIDIIGCFLGHLWNHAIDSISRSISAELLRKCRFHVVITIPAIWPHYSQQRMKQAAEPSGIVSRRPCGSTTLSFISEPEAAALATIKDLSRDRVPESAGDTLVVCDAGGGTVVRDSDKAIVALILTSPKDLISYVIESVEPFVVKECVKGDGGLCGGVFLDEEFIRLIKSKVTATAWDGLGKAEQENFLNDGWEHGIKPQFENQSRTWVIDLPDGCGDKSSGRKRRRTIELTTSEIQSVFAPVANKIVTLVGDQVNAVTKKFSTPPKYIILVGGFGRSRYLFNLLRTRFTQSTILQSRGSKPWTAICRGAVIHGLTQGNLSPNLQVKVEARVARFSYGFSASVPWIRGRYPSCDKYWCEKEYQHNAKDQMEWFLRQGDGITDKKPVCHAFFRILEKDTPNIEENMYYSSAHPPSSRIDATVQRLCTITWNQTVRFASLPTWTNSIGKVYRVLEYDIKMTSQDGIVEFIIYHKGNRVAGQNLEVEFN